MFCALILFELILGLILWIWILRVGVRLICLVAFGFLCLFCCLVWLDLFAFDVLIAFVVY